jgi:hypothetical protein
MFARQNGNGAAFLSGVAMEEKIDVASGGVCHSSRGAYAGRIRSRADPAAGQLGYGEKRGPAQADVEAAQERGNAGKYFS